MLFQLNSHTVNLPFTILFAQFFDKFYQPKFSDSAVILAISVSKRYTLDLSVAKAQGSISAGHFFPTIVPFQ